MFVNEAFVKAGLPESEARRMAGYFVDVGDRLHGACFYGLIYEGSEHKPLIEGARICLDLVRRLVEG